MNTQNEQYKKIDFLSLTDCEKAELIKAAKEALRQRVEEARFWRNIEQCN